MTKHARIPTEHIIVPANAWLQLPPVTGPKASLRQRCLAPLTLVVTWYRRSRFRTELRVDLRERPEYLRDIGIREHEAQAEIVRFFWEPVLLERR